MTYPDCAPSVQGKFRFRVGREDWNVFIATIGELRAGRAGWPAELERARLWYEPHLDRIYEDAVVRRADLIQLEQIATGYPSRERFLTELTLDPPDATSDQAGVPLLDEDYLKGVFTHSQSSCHIAKVVPALTAVKSP